MWHLIMKHFVLKLLILIMAFSPNLHAQRIKDPSYRILLKGLLSHSVDEISIEEADSMGARALFLDAREHKEFKISHIEKAIYVGYDSLDLSPINNIDREQEIIVYCSISYRSEKVAEKLVKLGYKNVHNMYGGIFEWRNQDKPLVNMDDEATDNVHAYNRMWGIWLKKGKKVY